MKILAAKSDTGRSTLSGDQRRFLLLRKQKAENTKTGSERRLPSLTSALPIAYPLPETKTGLDFSEVVMENVQKGTMQ